MCSIMGYCSRSISFYDFMKGFEKTKSRGPDDSRVVKTEKGILGFHRLSIMERIVVRSRFSMEKIM